MDIYDLIVIGTGTAAQVAAGRVRRAGRSVAVIDRRTFGGTCALRGCDPKKMLVSGAEAVDLARRMHRRGIAGGPAPRTSAPCSRTRHDPRICHHLPALPHHESRNHAD
jgi:pyruvate/2-oxoglutarate dehydrogenase complex dihydrolipoamide dehydrogenase (E3) component